LDIADKGGAPQASVSHYTVIAKFLGFQRPFGNKLYFEVETHTGKSLLFDADTGEIVSKEAQEIAGQLYDAEVAISALKYQWYEHNGKNNDMVITEEMLKKTSTTGFPKIPKGYQYIPDSVWKPVQFKKKE
jgi:hypothetical protein